MTNNLGRTTVAQSQGVNAFTAINDADGVMDEALTGTASVTVDNTNALTLTSANWLNQTITIGNGSPAPSGDITLTVPSTVRGRVTIVNSTSYVVSVEISGQSATAPVIMPGAQGEVHSDGVNVVAITGQPYDVPLSFSGTPTNGEVIGAFVVPRDVWFPADFSGSAGYVGTNPAATCTISVQDDGTEIGTIAISTAGAFTFATASNTTKTVASGSRLEFVGPATADASIAYILATLAGWAA